jgi:hypothetical protein
MKDEREGIKDKGSEIGDYEKRGDDVDTSADTVVCVGFHPSSFIFHP